MFFLLYSLLQLLILWMLLSMLFRLFKGDTARRDEWKQYSEWTYGSERQGGYGWSGSYGENPPLRWQMPTGLWEYLRRRLTEK